MESEQDLYGQVDELSKYRCASPAVWEELATPPVTHMHCREKWTERRGDEGEHKENQNWILTIFTAWFWSDIIKTPNNLHNLCACVNCLHTTNGTHMRRGLRKRRSWGGDEKCQDSRRFTKLRAVITRVRFHGWNETKQNPLFAFTGYICLLSNIHVSTPAVPVATSGD